MTPEQRFKCMSHNRAKNTGPEMLLRHCLWRLGFRYRLNAKDLPGSPDMVLPKYRTAIFVHGCFWHGHQNCKYYTIPKTNTDFWVAKVVRNKERDQDVWRKLEAKGWYVIIVWECQLKKEKLDETIERVITEIVRNGESFRIEQVGRRMARDDYRQELMVRRAKAIVLKNELKTTFKDNTK